ITDFTVGVDKLDFSGLIAASGYTGSNLVADGYLSIVSDGHGGSKLLFDIDGKGAGNPWAATVVTLDGVSPHGLTAGQLFGSSPAPTVPPVQAPVAPSLPVTAAPIISTPPATLTPTVVNLQGSNLAPSVLVGGIGADTLLGGQMDDSLDGLAGDDRLDGNDGNDLITGGDGFDRINGNSGNDTVRGGAGADWVHGGKSADQVFGDDGDDFVYGNIGNDVVYGGAGADIVRGGQGDDVLSGDAGDDWLSGDRGGDNITGGAGSDIFYSFAGAGLDLVTDFNRAQGDRIQLDVGQIHSVYQSGTDAIIDLGGGDQIILAGVNISALSGDWLIGG
uniref:type I secretion C-terminal target domain-containing protein n=1 Tax=Caulobacter sp. DWR1-3-2b1 TaxID=2804670 RepID=UPI003CF9F882